MNYLFRGWGKGVAFRSKCIAQITPIQKYVFYNDVIKYFSKTNNNYSLFRIVMLFITVILAVTFVPGITHDSRSTHLEAGQFNLTATRHRQSGHKDNSNLQPASLRSVIKDTLSSNNINSNNIASNPVNSSDYNANGSTQQWSNYTSVLPPGISNSNYTTVLPPGLSHSNYASVLTSGASYINNFHGKNCIKN